MITKERSCEIAEIYYNDVFNFCRSELKNDADAEDITQDVFLMFQKRYNEMNDTNIKSWLFNVTQKKILEKFREIKKKTKELSLDENINYLDNREFITEIDDNPDISDEEIERQKFKILERLTPEERELFKMIYFEHLKYSEIAERTDLTENAIAIRAMRMRNKIKKMVAEAFITVLLIILFFIYL